MKNEKGNEADAEYSVHVSPEKYKNGSSTIHIELPFCLKRSSDNIKFQIRKGEGCNTNVPRKNLFQDLHNKHIFLKEI